MAAKRNDIQVACARLGQRGLQECKLWDSPAYISREHTACAIITSRPDTIAPFMAGTVVPEAMDLEPAVIDKSAKHVKSWQNRELTYNRVHFPSDDQSQEFHLDAWTGSALGYDYGGVLEEDETNSQMGAQWDWRTGRILNGVQRAELESKKAPAGKSQRKAAKRMPSQMTLAASLSSLADTDCRRVIYARQVQKLGLRSDEALRKHCEQFGPVTEVLLSNQHSKSPEMSAFVRIRPSGIALVVMESKEDAAAILAGGETLVVGGVPIKIRQFEARNPGNDEDTPTDSKAVSGDSSDSTKAPGSECDTDVEGASPLLSTPQQDTKPAFLSQNKLDWTKDFPADVMDADWMGA